MKKNQLLVVFFALGMNISGQVGINTSKPNANTGLHVSERMNPASPNPDKINGVIIQRYTTTERNGLSLSAADHGLTIFNKTENCYNYWDGTILQWKKLCGQMGSAVLDTSAFNCSSDLEIAGKYMTNIGLTTNEYIKVKVKVDQIGAYDFKAYAQPVSANNGYSFSATGEFLSTGIQTVVLYGTGVPANGQTDTFKLTLNGIEVCSGQVKIKVSAPLKPLSGIKLGDVGTNNGFNFATPTFSAFMNSWSNFGPISVSKVYTDGSPLAPILIPSNESNLSVLSQYNILAVSYRNGIDITAAQRTALKAFAETPGKTLILNPEISGPNFIGLLNDLIGDITIVPADFTPIGNVGDTSTTGANWLTSDPANDPFLKGVFGNVTGTLLSDLSGGAPSLNKAKLDLSTNIQYIASRVTTNPTTITNVSAFKIKNKNVFWIEDTSLFRGGFGDTTGPACYTPQSPVMGVVPIPCAVNATGGGNSGGSMFSANLIYWALQKV